MTLAPWLCLSGDELGNAMRTLTYLRRGLGSVWIDVAAAPVLVTETHCREIELTGCGCADEYEAEYQSHYGICADPYQDAYDNSYGNCGDLYHDTYDDTYDDEVATETVCDPVGPLDAANLACYCEALDEGPYLSPADDDAPWYEPTRPESAEFLGLVPNAVTLLPTTRRGARATAHGSVIGPQTAAGFVVAVRADMFASSAEGMAWGERWLAEVLGAGLCDDQLDLEVLLACPADPDAAPFRSLPDVGVIDGPVYGATEAPECYWQQVAFQFASASPWLLAPEVVVREAAPLSAGISAYAQVVTADWLGGAGIRVEVVAGPAGMDDLLVRGLIGAGNACPPDNATPCWGFTVPSLAPGHRMVVDGATQEAYIENPATGKIVGGLDLFDFDGAFAFPEAAACSAVCVEVRHSLSGVGSSVRISSRGREL